MFTVVSKHAQTTTNCLVLQDILWNVFDGDEFKDPSFATTSKQDEEQDADENDDEEEDVDSHAVRSFNNGNLMNKTQRQSQTIRIQGASSIHAFYDYLLNWSESKREMRAKSHPILISSNPFLYSKLDWLKVSDFFF